MHRSTRNQFFAPLAMLLIAFVSLGAWSATAAWPFLAVGVVGGLAGGLLAIRTCWRLANRLRLLQEAMHKSERMRLLGQVSGGLAHQLRNAVAGAKLAIQLHARSCAGGDAESLDVARRQLARVEADLARFLDLGREDGQPQRPCHIVELVEEAVVLVRPRCRHADVQLGWEPPAADPVVLGDPGRLGHVIINLMTNAVEAAGPGGQVEVRLDPGLDCWVIEVWDSGPGPAAAVTDRLFQPFVTGKAEGVGLGLFVARQAAEAHGGRLDWRRERGRTCFRVELPTVAGDWAEEPAVAAGPAVRA